MSILEALLLGILQGLTEFLPVSSSGHLVLARGILGVEMPGVLFEVAVHMGTLLAILLHFRRDILDMLSSVLRFRRDEHTRLFLLLLLATVPAAAAGILGEGLLVGLYARPLVAGVLLVVTGFILLSTRLARRAGNAVGPASAIGIGIAQAFAILPGISRSGATITAGMHFGVDPKRAARFSFLLAIPALIGASALMGMDLAAHPVDRTVTLPCAVGAAAAFLSGYFALRWLLGIVSRGRLDRLAWYCLAVGCSAVIYFLWV